MINPKGLKVAECVNYLLIGIFVKQANPKINYDCVNKRLNAVYFSQYEASKYVYGVGSE